MQKFWSAGRAESCIPLPVPAPAGPPPAPVALPPENDVFSSRPPSTAALDLSRIPPAGSLWPAGSRTVIFSVVVRTGFAFCSTVLEASCGRRRASSLANGLCTSGRSLPRGLSFLSAPPEGAGEPGSSRIKTSIGPVIRGNRERDRYGEHCCMDQYRGNDVLCPFDSEAFLRALFDGQPHALLHLKPHLDTRVETNTVDRGNRSGSRRPC